MWCLLALTYAAKPSVLDIFGSYLKKGDPHEHNDGVNILESFFIKINTKIDNVNGGALCIYSKSVSTSIKFCFFDDCSSTGFGGALYIKSESPSIELYSIFCIECISAKSGNFLALSSRVDIRPQIDKIVVRRCGWSAKCAPAPIYIESGKPQVSYANITNNVVVKTSALQVHGSMNMRFANIIENQATEDGCLVLSEGFFNLNTINIIHNKQYSHTGATIMVPKGNIDLTHLYANSNEADLFLYLENEKAIIRNSFISDFKCNKNIKYEPESNPENSIKFMLKIKNGNVTNKIHDQKEKVPVVKFYDENLNPKKIRDEKNSNFNLVQYVVYGVIATVVIIIGLVLFIRGFEDENDNNWHGEMESIVYENGYENDYYLRR